MREIPFRVFELKKQIPIYFKKRVNFLRVFKSVGQRLGNLHKKKPVILEKQVITDFLSTRSRSRTGTVSHRCLRPARLPIPPSGLSRHEITTVISTQ